MNIPFDMVHNFIYSLQRYVFHLTHHQFVNKYINKVVKPRSLWLFDNNMFHQKPRVSTIKDINIQNSLLMVSTVSLIIQNSIDNKTRNIFMKFYKHNNYRNIESKLINTYTEVSLKNHVRKTFTVCNWISIPRNWNWCHHTTI